MQPFELDSKKSATNRVAIHASPSQSKRSLPEDLDRAREGLKQLAIAQESKRAACQFREEERWLEENRDRFGGQWVALQGRRLLAAGPTAREVFSAVATEKIPPLVTLVESGDLPFGGW
jgi:hypothetical protein